MVALLLLVAAAPALAETLADAIRTAYFNNPDILAQRAQLRALNERYVQARSAFGFSASASAAYQTQHASVGNFSSQLTGFDSSGNPIYKQSVVTNNFTASTQSETVSIVQPIYTGGRSHAALQAALANVFGGYQDVRRQESRVLDLVVNAYLDVQRDQQIVSISEENLKLLQGQVEQTRAELAVKEATLTDRDQGYARVAAAQAQLVLARSRLVASEASYRAVVGRDPGDLAPPPPLPDIAPSPEDAFRLAEEGSPLLLSAEYQEKSAQAGVEQARAETRPRIDLRGDVNQGPLVDYNSQLRDNTQTLRVVLTVPFFSSGQITSRIREARADSDNALDRYESARRQVRQDITQSWEQMRANREASALYDQQVQSQSGVYKGTKLEQRYALRSTLDVFNAAQELNNARIERATTAHDAYVGQAELLAVVGRLEPALFGITVPADLLDPDIRLLNKRDYVIWIGLLDKIDGIGQHNVVR